MNAPVSGKRSELPRSISVVVPCYNEEEVLAELHRRLLGVLERVGIPEIQVVLVDDGSKDRTWPIIHELALKDGRIRGVRLSRNFGHQIALTSGLDRATGEVILIIDADLQDPPELLPEMLALWRDGNDVVYGVRRRREGESPSKRFFAFAFYRVLSRITGVHIPADTGDFRLMSHRALTALLLLRERHRFVRGMVSWIGFRQCPIPYDRPQRFAGETKYPFRKSLKLAFDAITSFSTQPLRLASYLGLGVSGFAFIYILIVIVLKMAGVSFPGYTSLMASILLLGGVQLVVLGIVGEYVGRIFEQGQARPLYLIEDDYWQGRDDSVTSGG
jgi:glycosyltransferase involved in cell wall biosynthesis